MTPFETILRRFFGSTGRKNDTGTTADGGFTFGDSAGIGVVEIRASCTSRQTQDRDGAHLPDPGANELAQADGDDRHRESLKRSAIELLGALRADVGVPVLVEGNTGLRRPNRQGASRHQNWFARRARARCGWLCWVRTVPVRRPRPVSCTIWASAWAGSSGATMSSRVGCRTNCAAGGTSRICARSSRARNASGNCPTGSKTWKPPVLPPWGETSAADPLRRRPAGGPSSSDCALRKTANALRRISFSAEARGRIEAFSISDHSRRLGKAVLPSQ